MDKIAISLILQGFVALTKYRQNIDKIIWFDCKPLCKKESPLAEKQQTAKGEAWFKASVL